MKPANERPLVVALGNPDRGDDGAGPHVGRLIEPSGLADVAFIRSDTTELLDVWSSRRQVFVVDATAPQGEPGRRSRLGLSEIRLRAEGGRLSSHRADLGSALELAEVLGRLPEALVVYGIEGRAFELGEALSPAVIASAEQVARDILSELSAGNPID